MCIGMCEECDRMEAERQEKEELAAIVESWNWNLTPADCAVEIKRYVEDEVRWSEDEFTEEMKRQGHSDSDVYTVESVLEVL